MRLFQRAYKEKKMCRKRITLLLFGGLLTLCASGQSTCFRYSHRYVPVNGSDAVIVANTTDPSNCALACLEKAAAACEYWSFGEANGGVCSHFKVAKSTGLKKRFVSGPRQCIVSCDVRALDFTSGHGEPVDVTTSAKECGNSCVVQETEAACDSSTFPNGTCLASANSDDAAAGDADPPGRAIGQVPSVSCLLFGYAARKEASQTLYALTLREVGACSHRCFRHENCAFWSINATEDDKHGYFCALHTRDAQFVRATDGDASLRIVGHKDCSPPEHFLFGFGLVVQKVDVSVRVPNPTDCIELARKHATSTNRAWEWAADGHCSVGPSNFTAAERKTYVSGPLYCHSDVRSDPAENVTKSVTENVTENVTKPLLRRTALVLQNSTEPGETSTTQVKNVTSTTAKTSSSGDLIRGQIFSGVPGLVVLSTTTIMMMIWSCT